MNTSLIFGPELGKVIRGLHGGTWPHQEAKGAVLASLCVAIRPKIVVEIGVFGGASLIPMAIAVRENGSGAVIGIDPWENAASVEGQTGENRQWWEKLDHEAIYRDFTKAANEIGVLHVMQIIRKRSDDVTPPPEIDIFHCDGNHGPQAVRDVTRFAKNVRIGGFAILDDLQWDGGAVRLAERELFGFGFQMLYPLGTGALYQRVK